MNRYIFCGRGNGKSLSQFARALENVSANDRTIFVPADSIIIDSIIKEVTNEKNIPETEG